MANWERKLSLKDVWEKYPGEISVQELAKVISERLKSIEPIPMRWSIDSERQELAEDFLTLSEDEAAKEVHLNYLMSRLYDWGDKSLDNHWNGRKVCWIETIF